MAHGVLVAPTDLRESCGQYTSKDACAAAADRMHLTASIECSPPQHPVNAAMKVP